MKIFEFPVNPFPGFHWFILCSVILLGVTLNPSAVITTIIWFAVVSYNICNIICLRVVGVKYTLPSESFSVKNTWMDTVMFIPFLIMMFTPAFFLQELVIYIHELLTT